MSQTSEWLVLTRYDQEHLNKIALPLGGTGTVSLGGRGELPPVVKEAALYNVSTLRTQTCFRTPNGRLYAWEGCGHKAGTEVTLTVLFGTLRLNRLALTGGGSVEFPERTLATGDTASVTVP